MKKIFMLMLMLTFAFTLVACDEPTDHTHTACATCGKCVDAQCTGTLEERCFGHGIDVTTKVTFEIDHKVTEAEGVANPMAPEDKAHHVKLELEVQVAIENLAVTKIEDFKGKLVVKFTPSNLVNAEFPLPALELTVYVADGYLSTIIPAELIALVTNGEMNTSMGIKINLVAVYASVEELLSAASGTMPEFSLTTEELNTMISDLGISETFLPNVLTLLETVKPTTKNEGTAVIYEITNEQVNNLVTGFQKVLIDNYTDICIIANLLSSLTGGAPVEVEELTEENKQMLQLMYPAIAEQINGIYELKKLQLTLDTTKVNFDLQLAVKLASDENGDMTATVEDAVIVEDYLFNLLVDVTLNGQTPTVTAPDTAAYADLTEQVTTMLMEALAGGSDAEGQLQ